MKTKLMTTLLFTGLTSVALACGGDMGTKASHKNSIAQAVTVSVKEPDFKVSISSNPTTGYQLFLKGDYDHDLVELTGSELISPDAKNEDGSLIVGAPSRRVFHFHAKSEAFKGPQLFDLHFQTSRSWETKDLDDTVQTVRIFTGD